MLTPILFEENDRKIFDKLSQGNSIERRACEIFQSIVVQPKFKEFVSKTRIQYDIPFQGYTKEKALKKFGGYEQIIHRGKSKPVLTSLQFSDGDSSLEKYLLQYHSTLLNTLSINKSFLTELLKEYIILNKIILLESTTSHLNMHVYITQDSLLSDSLLRMDFSVDVTKEEIKLLIEKRWKFIDSLRSLERGFTKESRRKIWKTFPRDLQIYNKWVECTTIPKSKRKYKYTDTEVALFFDISEGYVKECVAKFKSLIKEGRL